MAGSTVTLTLGTKVRAGDRVELGYGPVQKWSNPRETIRVLKGTDGNPAPRFGGLHVVNNLIGRAAGPAPRQHRPDGAHDRVRQGAGRGRGAGGERLPGRCEGLGGARRAEPLGHGHGDGCGGHGVGDAGRGAGPGGGGDGRVHYTPPDANALTGAGTATAPK